MRKRPEILTSSGYDRLDPRGAAMRVLPASVSQATTEEPTRPTVFNAARAHRVLQSNLVWSSFSWIPNLA